MLRINTTDTKAVTPIIRDFDDPYLELIRLLKEASEIEHSLLIQYLYAAFSVKPKYHDKLVGPPFGGSNSLLGIAIQEMIHFKWVNEFLFKLGAMSDLKIQDFPYETDIYPFSLDLESLTKKSLAKYVFAEASAEDLDHTNPSNSKLLVELKKQINFSSANHLGSLYNGIMNIADEFKKTTSGGIDISENIGRLKEIKGQGEKDHFQFFKSVFLGEHAAFGGRFEIWDLDSKNIDYPSFILNSKPTLLDGNPETEYGEFYDLAKLGTLHYWILLFLLNQFYRNKSDHKYQSGAVSHMQLGVSPIGFYLAKNNKGFPFDNLSLGFNPGIDQEQNNAIIRKLCEEGIKCYKKIKSKPGSKIPEYYDDITFKGTISSLTDQTKLFFESILSSLFSQRYSEQMAIEFWYKFDNTFAYDMPPDVANYSCYITHGIEYIVWHFKYDYSNFKDYILEYNFKDFINFIVPAQLRIINSHFNGDNYLVQRAFEDFGMGILYNPLRKDPKYNGRIIHSMNTPSDTGNPTGQYCKWHAVLRAFSLINDPLDSIYLQIDRYICLAWKIQMEIRPQPTLQRSDGSDPHNQRMADSQLSDLRRECLSLSYEEIDRLFRSA